MKKIIPLFGVLALPMVALNAQADSGTINFAGNITAPTCTITIGGDTSGNASVTLADVKTSELQTAGSVAGKTQFDIELTGCTLPDSKTQVGALFAAGAGVDSTTRTLNNTGTANNVSIRLSDSTGAVIQVGSGAMADTEFGTVAADKSVTLSYSAEYISIAGGATAGDVKASATYSLTYN